MTFVLGQQEGVLLTIFRALTFEDVVYDAQTKIIQSPMQFRGSKVAELNACGRLVTGCYVSRDPYDGSLEDSPAA